VGFVRKLVSVAGAAAGGAFAGSGIGVVAGYTVVPLALRYWAEGVQLGIPEFTVLILTSAGSGATVGAGVGAIRRLRRLRAGPVAWLREAQPAE